MTAIFTALLALTTALSPTNGPVLSTAREVRLATVEDCARRRPVRLTGTVTSISPKERFTLHDGAGGVLVYNYANPAYVPRTGDVIMASGTLAADELRRKRVHVGSIVLVGRGPVPEPLEATPKDILSGELDYCDVRVRGTVIDIFADDIDTRDDLMMLYADGCSVCISLPRARRPADAIRLIGAEVVVRGFSVSYLGGLRIFAGSGVNADYSDITVVADAKPADAEPIRDLHHIPAERFASMTRKSASGTVLAVYRGDRFLMSTAYGQVVGVELSGHRPPPRCGAHVRVVGFPTTDMYHVNFSNAEWLADGVPAKPPAEDPATNITAAALMTDGHGLAEFKVTLHGKPVRLRGRVIALPAGDFTTGEMLLQDGTLTVAVDVGATRDACADTPLGGIVEVTGICVMETDSWRPNAPYPRIRRPLVVVRTPDDVRVLVRPPWWTPRRLLLVIAVLCVGLVSIFVWNLVLNRLVERRSRALLREHASRDEANVKFEERTRLAVELHDTVSQTLTGVALEIDAAQMAADRDPDAVSAHLDSVSAKMRNCRENLRQCLWDLRSRAYEEPDLAVAIRRTVAPFLGPAALDVDCAVRTRNLSDNTTHHVLGIVRELVANAVRHGRCTRIGIAAVLSPAGIALTVKDDGVGFDVQGRLGSKQGHFGLQGVSERVRRLGGRLEISSVLGAGTTVSIANLNPES